VATGLAKWDDRFMAMAELVSTWSRDPNGGVGCVLVSPDRRRTSIGYNGLPRDYPSDLEATILQDRELKNQLCLHAEENAIANAGCDLTSWTLYSTFAPCVHCALVIHQHRIARVVCPITRLDSRWRDEQLEAARQLKLLGVEVNMGARY
jgi:deoxycytidylate deaminase